VNTAVSGETFNVGCGSRTTLLDVVGHLNELLGTGLQPTQAARRDGDVMHSQADITKAAELLGYRPTSTVREGLASTAEWFAQRPATELATAKERVDV
jgi:UDP-N-acetylglucosamine/UDP-N-acetylgalactosamine 4-epimerase